MGVSRYIQGSWNREQARQKVVRMRSIAARSRSPRLPVSCRSSPAVTASTAHARGPTESSMESPVRRTYTLGDVFDNPGQSSAGNPADDWPVPTVSAAMLGGCSSRHGLLHTGPYFTIFREKLRTSAWQMLLALMSGKEEKAVIPLPIVPPCQVVFSSLPPAE